MTGDARTRASRSTRSGRTSSSPTGWTEIAERRGITPAQLALAWVMAKGEDIVPIPGTKSPRRLEENAAAAEIKLSAQDVEELDNAISPEAVRGDRYPEGMMALLNN